MADVFLQEALNANNGVTNAYYPSTHKFDTDLHWWPQIEAMTGLCYLWETTGESHYLDVACDIWEYTQLFIIDKANGEWFFRVDTKGQPYLEEDKVGPWKCPYHNSRGLMEIISLVS